MIKNIRIHSDFLFFLCAIWLIYLLTGCSIISYEGRTDGSTVVTSKSLFTDSGLEKFSGSVKPGERRVSFSGLDADQTTSIDKMSQLLGNVVGTAIKAAK